MAQFSYAFDSNNVLTNINSLPNDRSLFDLEYHCLVCNSIMIAKTKGLLREKHFAHKGSICSQETYLHRLGKEYFAQIYKSCLGENKPFEICISHSKICSKYKHILGASCHLGEFKKTYDLTQYYDSIKVEAREAGYIPDLILYNSKIPSNKIFIEIAVTHFLSVEKEYSNEKIIEIALETESDLQIITNKRLSEAYVRYLNFDRSSKQASDSECHCANYLFSAFIVYSSGKCFVLTGSLRDIDQHYRKVAEKIVYSKLYHHEKTTGIQNAFGIFREYLVNATQEGFKIKNCYLCSNYSMNFNRISGKPIYCKAKKTQCESNDGAHCNDFIMKSQDKLL